MRVDGSARACNHVPMPTQPPCPPEDLSRPAPFRLARLLASACAGFDEKLRFLVVGMGNTAFAYVLFLVTLNLVRMALGLPEGTGNQRTFLVENHYLVAQWISWVLSVPFGTLTLKHLVFKGTGRLRNDIFRAYFVYFPGLGISSVTLWTTVTVFGLIPEIGQLLTIGVAAVFSYLGHKYFTFAARRAD